MQTFVQVRSSALLLRRLQQKQQQHIFQKLIQKKLGKK